MSGLRGCGGLKGEVEAGHIWRRMMEYSSSASNPPTQRGEEIKAQEEERRPLGDVCGKKG